MKGRAIFIAAILVVSIVALTGVVSSVAATEKIDLFLLIDGSGSVAAEDYINQTSGYAAAIDNESIVPQDGSVSICVIMFGFKPGGVYNPQLMPYNVYNYAKVIVPYTTITNAAVAKSVSETISNTKQPGDGTPIEAAFHVAIEELKKAVKEGKIELNKSTQKIDISSDGRPNMMHLRDFYGKFRDEKDKEAVYKAFDARTEAIAAGFDEINALGVDLKDTTRSYPYNREFLEDMVLPQPCDTEPPGFFMETSRADFPKTLKEKIKIELHPFISVNKSVSKILCNPGDVLTYTINYSNTNNVNLTEVVLTDPIPATTTTLVSGSISNGGTVSLDGVITWNIGELHVGKAGTQSFQVRVHDHLTNGTIITNTATIASNETGPVSDSVNTTVISHPHISITKSVGEILCNPGDVLHYTINYSNTNNVNLTEVVLTDPIPATTTLVSGSISNGGTVSSDGVITWNIGELHVGESGMQSFRARVHDSLANGTIITNTATIASNETGPVSASVTTTVIVPKIFELSAYKAVDKMFASPNETLCYQIQYKNTGTETLTHTEVKDTIPENTTYIAGSMGLNGEGLTDGAGDDAGSYYAGNKTLIWDIGTLEPGEGGDATFKVTINAFVPGGTIIRNTAILTTNETLPINRTVITKVRPPILLPVLTSVGIAVLIGLLSLVAIRGMSGRRR
ncbi:MAG: DUF1194 domain-containing protein [Halobacteriota archaeon]